MKQYVYDKKGLFHQMEKKDDYQPREKIINIEKKKRRMYVLQVENLCMTYYIHYGAQKINNPPY